MNEDQNEDQGREWGEFKSMNMNDIQAIKDVIESSDMEMGLMRAMVEELAETSSDEHNVLFISTSGDMAIKAIHVPPSALDGKNGPVIFPHSNPRVILAAFSRDFINDGLSRIEDLEPGLRDDQWEEFIGSLNDLIELEYMLQGPVEDPFDKGFPV